MCKRQTKMDSITTVKSIMTVATIVVMVAAVADKLLVDLTQKEKELQHDKCCNCWNCCIGYCADCVQDNYRKVKKQGIFFFIYLFGQVAVAAAIIYILYQSGYYYDRVQGVSATTINVFGAAHAPNVSGDGSWLIWDSNDLAEPAAENNMVFITTRIVTTYNQSRSECAEPDSVAEARCSNHDDCLPVGKPFPLGYGLSTGQCNNVTQTCNVYAWCPIENGVDVREGRIPEQTTVENINGTESIILLIKNHVQFRFTDGTDLHTSNIVTPHFKTSGEICSQDGDKHPHCPFIKLDYIYKKLDFGHDIVKTGGVVLVKILWDCDGDRESSECKPTYHFTRLDKGEEFSWGASGYNYSDTIHSYYDQNVRHHTRSIGVLFVLEVDAEATKTYITPSLVANQLGAVIALTKLPSAVIDFIAIFVALFCCAFCRGEQPNDPGENYYLENTRQFDSVSGNLTKPKGKADIGQTSAETTALGAARYSDDDGN